MGKAIVLLSGGMDSTVTAAFAAKKGGCAFLHVNYGQRTESRELKSFNAIADFYGVTERLVVDISHLRLIGGSALTDRNIDVPGGELERKDVPATYVPFRNAHLLSIAVSWAEVTGAKEIYIGAVEEDGSGYPDCTLDFFKSFEIAANLGTRPETRITIVAPLISLRKSDIVKKGVELGAPFHLTWSCYSDEEAACGECDSCLLRLRGFREAGVTDPIHYRGNALKGGKQ
ncbi:7-cyano-7-deazaguanine synthase QueC [bacterium]|nr:7-cyano-7-deazaguanine synthase QueC [bacterium]